MNQMTAWILLIMNLVIFAGGILWLNDQFTKMERKRKEEK